jgi:hypothetical protein
MNERIEKPEPWVLDFLNKLEKETPVRLDLSTLTGIWAMGIPVINEIPVWMPKEFYSLKITNFPMEMHLKFCPCKYCHRVEHVELYIGRNDDEISNANYVMERIKKVAPDLRVYISLKPEPAPFEDYMANICE